MAARRKTEWAAEKETPREPLDWEWRSRRKAGRRTREEERRGLRQRLQTLVQRNRAQMSAFVPEQGQFRLEEDAVAFLLTAAVDFGLPRHCRQLALRLFDEAMAQEVRELRRLPSPSPADDAWDAALEDLRARTALTALSALQLAAKTVSVHAVLEHQSLASYARVQGLAGPGTGRRDCAESELRVLRLVGFSTDRLTAQECVEAVLAAGVGLGRLTAAAAGELYAVAGEAGDVLELRRGSVYGQLMEETVGLGGPGGSGRGWKAAYVAGDAMLAGAGCLVASALALWDKAAAGATAELCEDLALVPIDDSSALGLVLYELLANLTPSLLSD